MLASLFDGNNIIFSNKGCIIQDQCTGKIKGRGRRIGPLFALDFGKFIRPHECFFLASSADFMFNHTWHLSDRCISHPHGQKLDTMFQSNLLSKYISHSIAKSCITCSISKSIILPFTNSNTQSSSPVEIIRSDSGALPPLYLV